MKYYQVLLLDERNSLTEVGCYNSLLEAEKELNLYLQNYTLLDDDGEPSQVPAQFGDGQSLGRLQEYTHTFCTCFDRLIETEEGTIGIRGFIKDTQDTIEEMTQLEVQTNGEN